MLPLSSDDAPLWTTSDSRFDEWEHYLQVASAEFDDDFDDEVGYSYGIVEPERYIG